MSIEKMENGFFEVEANIDLVQASFFQSIVSSTQKQFSCRAAGAIYRLVKKIKEKRSKVILAKRFPEFLKIQEKARLGGGLSGNFQFLRLLELHDILTRLNPRSAIELGSGASTAVFASFFQDKSIFTSVDENQFWMERTKMALGDLSTHVNYILANRIVAERNDETTCHYDIDHSKRFELVYVDGPSNLAPDGAIQKDGTQLIANSDVELMWEKGNYPKFILIDGRRATLRRLLIKGKNKYRTLIKTDLLPQKNVAQAFNFQYHTLMLLAE